MIWNPLIWTLPRKIGVVVGAVGALLCFGTAIEKAATMTDIGKGLQQVILSLLVAFLCLLLFLFSIPPSKEVKS